MLVPSDDLQRPASSPALIAQENRRALRADQEAHEISTASERLRALAALSGSLTDSLRPEDAANLVEQRALSVLGATSAVVMTLGRFPPVTSPSPGVAALHVGARLRVLHAIGVPADVRAALEEIPLEASTPLAEVARAGEPLFLTSDHELRRDRSWGAGIVRAGAGAAAVVPVWANGELRGVLGLTWGAPRDFDEDERAFVLTLGVMCAQAIMRAYLREAEWKAREEAERASQSKTNFLTMISHELRTPMNAVIGYTDLLANELCGPVSALQKDHLVRVRASGNHLLELIEELLAYARLEAGEAIVAAESIRLIDVVEQSLVLVRPLAEKKGLAIRVEGCGNMVEVYTDPLKLRQILVNLLANAVKYTESGDVVLLIRLDGENAGPRIHLEVTDTGRGIASEDQERVFDAFWQEGPQRRGSAEGTGLGLSVARQFARLLGGDVVIANSAPGNGSTFVLSLPPRYAGPEPTVAAAASSGDRSARDS